MTSSTRVVLLTQPAPRVATIAASLSRQGHEPLVLTFSMFETACFSDAVAIVRSRIFCTPDLCAPGEPDLDLVVFVSPSAVLAFQGESQSSDLSHWPDAIAVATVGPGTLDALVAGGLTPSVRRLAPKQAPWDARSLLDSIRGEGVRPRRVLIIGGSTSGTDWAAEFQAMGVVSEYLAAYCNHPCEPDRAAVDRLYALCAERAPWVGVVTQASTADALNRIASDWPSELQRWMHAQPVLAIHPRIEQSLNNAGFHSIQRIAPGALALEAALSSDLWSIPRTFP